MTEAEAKKIDADIAHLNALTAQALANIEKMQIETLKLQTEHRWYVPFSMAAGASAFTLAIVAVAKLFL